MDSCRCAVEGAGGQTNKLSGIHTPKVVQMAAAGGAQRPKAMQHTPKTEIYFQIAGLNSRVYTNL
jgi:hypothetical protein